MNKKINKKKRLPKAKVIQIDGFKGLALAVFAVVCLAAGFIAFPGFVAMNIWNHFSSVLPTINLLQGVLLWSIVAITCYIANGSRVLISFDEPVIGIPDEEMQKIIDRVRLQAQAKALNSMMLKSGDEKPDFNKEVTSSVEENTEIQELKEEIKK